MEPQQETIVVTGVSGNLGQRLLPHLSGYRVIGIDIRPPAVDSALFRFESMDLGRESSCDRLFSMLRETGASGVIHLAFVTDPQRLGILDETRMWQINVAGTARVMEAIAVANRQGAKVSRFIVPSSVAVYGPETPAPVKEDYRLAAHTLPYAVHKMESDRVVQYRAESLGNCTTYVLRAHIFTGASMQNYMVGALRGTPTGNGELGRKWRERGKRLPVMIPFGEENLQKRLQFVHVDDMARLITWLVDQKSKGSELVVLNVAGRGEPITIGRCTELANAKVLRLPRWLSVKALEWLWNRGISAVPPQAFPYMVGSYTMDTTRLQRLLGKDFERVIHYTSESALMDSFLPETAATTYQASGQA